MTAYYDVMTLWEDMPIEMIYFLAVRSVTNLDIHLFFNNPMWNNNFF